MSKGITPETLDGIDLEYFARLSKDLRNGTFKFTPSRKILIPKGAGKKGSRPLSIGSPRDKIVQKAITIVLENIFESSFLNTSHGFRPNRGTHSALKMLHILGGNYN